MYKDVDKMCSLTNLKKWYKFTVTNSFYSAAKSDVNLQDFLFFLYSKYTLCLVNGMKNIFSLEKKMLKID